MIQYLFTLILMNILGESNNVPSILSEGLTFFSYFVTVFLGVIATVLALQQSVTFYGQKKRIKHLDAKIRNIEEKADLEKLQLDINMEIDELHRKSDTLLYAQLNEWSWDDEKRKRAAGGRIAINNALDRAVLELQLFHRSKDNRLQSARALAYGVGNLQSLRYMREILEVRRKAKRAEDRKELAELDKFIGELEKRLFEEKTLAADPGVGAWVTPPAG